MYHMSVRKQKKTHTLNIFKNKEVIRDFKSPHS